MHFSAFSRATPLLEADFKPFSAHWAFCLSLFLANTHWLLLYLEYSPAYPGQQHCPELGPCDLYHKIWFIFVLSFYMLLLFLLLPSLHCWEALWPGTLSTFIFVIHLLPSLWWKESGKFMTKSKMKSNPLPCQFEWGAVGKFYPLKSSELLRLHKAFPLANHMFFGERKVWVPFLACAWVIPAQMLCLYPMDA